MSTDSSGANDADQSLRFVGARFERWPNISGIGTLIRLSRLNQYQPQDYQFAFSLHVRRQDDLNTLLTFSPRRKDQLAAALSIQSDVRVSWDLAPWLPFVVADELKHQNWCFRYCLGCLQYGYHTLLHQLPWIERCPWHGVRLRSGCSRCGKPLPMNGVSGNWLGVCTCGHDHFDPRKALLGLPKRDAAEASAFADRYLRWAQNEQNEVQLLPPMPSSTDFSALAEAISLPPDLRSRVQWPRRYRACGHLARTAARSVRRGDYADGASALAKLECLRETGGIVIETPRPLAHRIAEVACRLAKKMPPASLSDAEMTLFLEPLGVEADSGFVPARRRSLVDIGTLSLRMIGERTYLDLRCVSPVTRQAAFRLLEAYKPPGIQGQESSWREMHQDQLWNAVAAAGDVLVRGYAEGIRIVLGRHVPELYGLKRERPHLSEPWILVRRRAADGISFRIIWARLARIPD